MTVKDVRVVKNRGRDVGALFIGLRDVVIDGDYDYVCRLHSKVSPQDVYGGRHFKSHLFENLLASPVYVGNLLSLFESEPRMGMAMPPVVHIGYPTLGNAWFTNKPAAAKWAKQLGIRVPFDEYTPLAAYGSMYWFRPEALSLLFNAKLGWSDFAEEPNYGDGGLAHVLERLVAYACHQNGFYAKAVMTPRRAAESYVKLEYKLQRLVGETNHLNQARAFANGRFPIDALVGYANSQLADVPAAQKVFQGSVDLTRAGWRLAKRVKKRLE